MARPTCILAVLYFSFSLQVHGNQRPRKPLLLTRKKTKQKTRGARSTPFISALPPPLPPPLPVSVSHYPLSRKSGWGAGPALYYTFNEVAEPASAGTNPTGPSLPTKKHNPPPANTTTPHPRIMTVRGVASTGAAQRGEPRPLPTAHSRPKSRSRY